MFMLECNRYSYTDITTIGRLILNDEYFSYSLEDTTRGENVKIAKKTAIPAGLYRCEVTYSPKYKRQMPLIYSNREDFSLEVGKVRFEGLRLHGGNDADDTDGCILTAKNFIDADTIQGSMSGELTRALQDLGGLGWINITNN